MAIIVEDGTIVTNANSFVTRDEYIAYAASLGVTIAADEAADVQLVKAGEFIAGKESQLKGDLTDRDQPMPYPRYNLTLENFHWSSNEIPRQAILCQMQLALDINAGIDLYNLPQSDGTAVKRERVEGAVEVEYAVGDSMKVSRNSQSRALLSTLMTNSGLSVALVMA